MVLSRESVVLAAPNQISCQLDDEAALLNLETGVYYGLDPIGAYIWQHLTQPKSVGALCEMVVQEYRADAKVVETDVLGFLSEMLAAGLVKVEK